MKSVSEGLPKLSKISAALRNATETLARELALPTDEAPQWTEFEWRIAWAVTAMHGVSSLLCDGLHWEGPDSWRRFLRLQRHHSVGRYEQIARLLDEIDLHARRQGIACVALKGAALNAAGVYAPGERPMGDIDLLIRTEDAKAIARVLDDCGYESAFTIQRHQVFQPRTRRAPACGLIGEHVDNPIKIEVHMEIAERLPVAAVDITRFLYPRMARAGLNAYPSAACLMMHLMLHAAGNMRARALRLIQLHDIALLARRFRPSDWEELFAAHRNGGRFWWAFAPATLTARYYPNTIPPGLIACLSQGCPRWLRQRSRRQLLADVSWSNIRIEAFPGVEWSRTPLEAAKFMRSRIWPTRAALLELNEGAAQIPQSSTVPWYGISHGARILRWTFSRPPRVQTLLSVRAAFANEA